MEGKIVIYVTYLFISIFPLLSVLNSDILPTILQLKYMLLLINFYSSSTFISYISISFFATPFLELLVTISSSGKASFKL